MPHTDPLNTVSVSNCRGPHGPKTEWLKPATKVISASVGQESRSGLACWLQLCVARDTAVQTSAGLWSSEGLPGLEDLLPGLEDLLRAGRHPQS